MLTNIELLYDSILSENEIHDNLIINILVALYTIQNKSFLGMIEKLQDEYDAGDKLTTQEIITRVTTKYNKLLNRNQYYYKDTKKYLSFKTNG